MDLLKYSSRSGENVLDPFGGSGSTLIACEQLNRKAFINELDETYVDVIVKRYIDFKESNEDCYLIRDGVKTPLSEIEEFEESDIVIKTSETVLKDTQIKYVMV